MTYPDSNPFDVPEKRPALSFKDAPVGATVTCQVADYPKKVQSRDFETGKPETWDDGNPKWDVVVDIIANGTDMSLWAPQTRKDGSLFMAIANAQRQAGQGIAPGGNLTITVTGYEPPDNPRMSPRRLYAATYTPGGGVFDVPQATVTNLPNPPQPAAAAPGSQPPPWAS